MRLLFYIAFLLLVTGCGCVVSSTPGFEDEERLLGTDPQAAFERLSAYDVAGFDDSATMARWALLYSEAMAASRMWTPTDTIINIAIDYYSRRPQSADYLRAREIRAAMEACDNKDALVTALYSQKEKEYQLYRERLCRQQYLFAAVVVVLLQYRLSALGWLALPELSAENEHGVSGNYAVLDLVHGLKWVRDNIAGFGGEPSKVTIAGQSAGAMAVTCLLRTPLAKGLFRAAIVQSGFNGFLNVGTMKTEIPTLKEAEEKNAAALKEIFGHEVTTEELRALSSADFLKPGPNAKPGMGGQPMTLLQEISQAVGHMAIDGYVFTEESFDLLKPGNLEGIQIMMGGTSDEATSLFGDFISQMGITPENAAQRLEEEYGSGCAVHYRTSTKEEAEAAVMRVQSDQCLQKYRLTAALTEENQAHETYVYYFRQVPPGRNAAFRGAYHSSELWYMFDSIREGVAHREWRSEDYETAELMSTYWMNFVKYGNPNGESPEEAGHTASGKEMAVWKPCRREDGLSFLDLAGGTSRMTQETDYPERDQYHRSWLEEQLSGK